MLIFQVVKTYPNGFEIDYGKHTCTHDSGMSINMAIFVFDCKNISVKGDAYISYTNESIVQWRRNALCFQTTAHILELQMTRNQ